MLIDTNAMISVTDANKNFSQASHLAEKNGSILMLKNNRPKFMLIDLDSNPVIEMTDDEKFEFVVRRVLREHKAAFMELAK